jgi:hypothetical protein
MRRSFLAAQCVLTLFVLAPAWAAGQEAAPQERAAPAWKPFQEFGFLTGAWSGTAESGGRVGGRVSRWTLEMGGNYLVHRGTTLFPAQNNTPEDSTEEVGYVAYDRDRRKYVAWYFYSTGVAGFYDVDFPSEGVIRLVSSTLLNYDSGARTRLTITKKSESEVTYQLDVAPGGKEFVTFITSKLSRK